MAFDVHPFSYLRSQLGPPGRTFSYAHSGRAAIDDHVWRCGCTAREEAALCTLIPCGTHRGINRPALRWPGSSMHVRPEPRSILG